MTRQPSTRKPGGSADPPVTAEPRTAADPIPMLVNGLAYALARAALPSDQETSRDYAERLAPLLIASGYLSVIREAEAAGSDPSGADVRASSGATVAPAPARPAEPRMEVRARDVAVHRLMRLAAMTEERAESLMDQVEAEAGAPSSRVDQAENSSASPDAEGAGSLDSSHAFPPCLLCNAAVDDPEASEPCELPPSLSDLAAPAGSLDVELIETALHQAARHFVPLDGQAAYAEYLLARLLRGKRDDAG